MNFHPGLKIWSTNLDLLGEAVSLVHSGTFEYIELLVVPGSSIEAFLVVDIPFALHAATERFGVNIADKTRVTFNRMVMDECFSWADALHASHIILHPGFGDIENALAFLDDIDDRRVLIENMPKVGLNDEKLLGYSVRQLELMLKKAEYGFCLDLNHAAKAAVSMKTDYKEVIEEMMAFIPVQFHLSDGRLNEEFDLHLPIGKGDFDMNFFYHLTKEKRVTFETPRTIGLEDDVTNLATFIQKGAQNHALSTIR
jgi:deoxyribonuclease IV